MVVLWWYCGYIGGLDDHMNLIGWWYCGYIGGLDDHMNLIGWWYCGGTVHRRA